jgi:hypothetical protein
MKTKRALSALAATVTAASLAAAVYSPAASATSTVSCYSVSNGSPSIWWFHCTSSNGTNTIWYINGVHKSEGDGLSTYDWFCTYNRKYTISVNLGTSLAASWTGYCRQDY